MKHTPLKKQLAETVRRHKDRLLRHVEYRRLKRIRRKKVPAYSYCKNCGTKLDGMYCYQCGQYALDIEQPFWKYLLQYVENVYQFDGKVWLTLYLLFRKPGFLTEEFNAGKIRSYVHPMRLFMFLSCLFFIFSFSLVPDSFAKVEKFVEEKADTSVALNGTVGGLSYEEFSAYSHLPDTAVWFRSDTAMLDEFRPLVKILDSPYRDTARIRLPKALVGVQVYPWVLSDTIFVHKEDTVFRARRQPGAELKDEVRDLEQDWSYGKMVSWYSSYWPIVVLLLIPVFALYLKALFRKEGLGYMSHLVLALHLHSVLLIQMALYLVWYEWVGICLVGLGGVLIVYYLAYILLSIHRVYRKSHWIKALYKTVILLGIYLLTVSVVLVGSLYWIAENIL